MKKFIKLLPFLLTILLFGVSSSVVGYIWEAVINGFKAGKNTFQTHGESYLATLDPHDPHDSQETP